MNDAPCCRRNDKSRCCYCSVYMNFLGSQESGILDRTARESFPDEGFERISRNKIFVIA